MHVWRCHLGAYQPSCRRYSAQRQQFGPPGGAEISVLDYQTQQTRLMPVLATAYALHWARDGLVAQYCEMKKSRDPRLVEEVHALSAGETPATVVAWLCELERCPGCPDWHNREVGLRHIEICQTALCCDAMLWRGFFSYLCSVSIELCYEVETR